MTQTQDYSPKDMIDLKSLLQTIWRGKWIIIISMLTAGVLGFLAISQMTARYKASAKVMFNIQQTNIIDIDDVISSQNFDEESLADQIHVLESTTLMNRVIDVLKLDQNKEFNPELREPEKTVLDRVNGVFGISGALTSVLQNFGILAPPPPPLTEEEAAEQERLIVIENLRQNLNLRSLGRSRVIEISYSSTSPKTARRVVNAVADQYIVDQLEAKLEATRSATSWLSVRVEELRDRVESDENAVEQARAEISVSTGQSLEVTQQQLQSLNGALANIRSEITRQTALFERLTQAVAQELDLGSISEFRQSPIVQRYRNQEDELLLQQASLSQTVPENHPARVRIGQQLGEIQTNLQKEADRIVGAVEIDLKAARDQEAALLLEVRALEQTALEQARNQVQLRQLDREADASRILYENFLGRLQETTQQEDLQTADARVLSPAQLPLAPESGQKRIILVMSLILGAMFGAGVVFLLDILNNTFRAAQQIEEYTGERVLATIPAQGTKSKRSEVLVKIRDSPGSALGEAVRNLRTSILFSNIDRPPKVLMFTSSLPSEGKSTTSMMLALTSQQMGKRTIVVDCDLRLPVVAGIMGGEVPEGPDILDVLGGTAQPAEAIHRDPSTGLHMLMKTKKKDTTTINAADILSSQRFADLIAALSKAFDMVILDTPPVVVVSDARIISKVADAVVYAVRWDNTPRGAVAEGLKELRSVDAPLAGIVMTMVNEAKAARYSYEGYGYYRGRYDGYYSS